VDGEVRERSVLGSQKNPNKPTQKSKLKWPLRFFFHSHHGTSTENPPSFDKKYEYCKFIEEASRDLRDTEKKKLSRKTKRKIAATKHYFRQYYNELVLYLARRKLRFDLGD
jgi:hypothetical protein